MRAENSEPGASTPTPPEAAPPSSPPPSAPAPPETVCGWEPFSLIVRELWPLLKRHYGELGAYEEAPLDPDWDRYYEYERAGILRIWAMRAEGVLIGYVVCQVIHGLHSRSTRYCYADLFWVAPEWRDGLSGMRMFRGVLKALRGLGVSNVRWETNDTFEPGPDGRSRVVSLLERLGFRKVGTVLQKVLTRE